MRRFLAGKVSVVEDGRMDGYYEEGEKYRNKRNYVPLVSLHRRRFMPKRPARHSRTGWKAGKNLHLLAFPPLLSKRQPEVRRRADNQE
jgi:hypothetical protein